jgi:steroid 5-alpha reductase family enzyme
MVITGFFFIFILLIYLSCMVAFAQWKGDTSIANFTWGGGVMLVALISFFFMSSFFFRQILATLLIVLWATRLILYIYIRYTGKDPRFVQWKRQGIKALLINTCWIFGQSIMIIIMSQPILLINTTPIEYQLNFNYLDLIGIIIWAIGFCYESVSDYQLFVFMRNASNKGKIMRSGLWHYSRHPNYFGEILMWWGIFIIALSVEKGFITIITPITITFLLLFVTGIPWIEKAMAQNPEYHAYKRITSAFIPWFVKSH